MAGQRQNISSGSSFEPAIGFSRAVRVGDVIAVSGTAPIGQDGRLFGAGSTYAQTCRCIEIARLALEQAGASLADVIRTRVMLKNIEDWREAARAHAEFFGEIRPASTFVQVTGFIDPGWLVEIEVDAAIG